MTTKTLLATLSLQKAYLPEMPSPDLLVWLKDLFARCVHFQDGVIERLLSQLTDQSEGDVASRNYLQAKHDEFTAVFQHAGQSLSLLESDDEWVLSLTLPVSETFAPAAMQMSYIHQAFLNPLNRGVTFLLLSLSTQDLQHMELPENMSPEDELDWNRLSDFVAALEAAMISCLDSAPAGTVQKITVQVQP